jgi:hypothetical protein
MHTSYESLRIVHEQMVQDAQDRAHIQAELQEAQPQLSGWRTLVGLLRKVAPAPIKPPYAECDGSPVS